MILYLLQKYVIHSAVFFAALVIFPLGFSDNTGYVLVRGFFFGGLLGAGYTFYDFRKRNLWPLYDNLRVPKYLLLCLFFAGFQSLYLVIKPFI